MDWLRFFMVFVCVMVMPGVVLANDIQPNNETGAVYGLIVENDVIGGRDRNYTNGVALTVISPPDDVHPLMRKLANRVPLVEAGNPTLRQGLILSHSMFTPEDISLTTPNPNDRPYAAWLNTGFLVNARTKRRLDTAQLNVGWVGPAVQGEWIQENVHNLIRVQRPNGWDHQLHNEPTVGLVLERKYAWQYDPVPALPFIIELGTSTGAAIGNAHTYAALGGHVRFGPHLGQDFGPPRVRPALSGSAFFDSRNQFNWYVFGGIEGRAVARNIFLDGNTFQDSPSVNKRPFVGDAQAGVAVQLGRAQVGLSYVWRTETFHGQDGADQFGAVSLLFRR